MCDPTQRQGKRVPLWKHGILKDAVSCWYVSHLQPILLLSWLNLTIQQYTFTVSDETCSSNLIVSQQHHHIFSSDCCQNISSGIKVMWKYKKILFTVKQIPSQQILLLIDRFTQFFYSTLAWLAMSITFNCVCITKICLSSLYICVIMTPFAAVIRNVCRMLPEVVLEPGHLIAT